MSVEDHVNEGLVNLTQATRRAYASDFADLCRWCEGHGLDLQSRPIGGHHVFAYALELAREGRAPSTIRRRLTALRRIRNLTPPPRSLTSLRTNCPTLSDGSLTLTRNKPAYSSSQMMLLLGQVSVAS